MEWATVRATTILLMGWAMVRATTVLLMEWAMARATTILMGWAMVRPTTYTNLSPTGMEWDWASERARLWAMLWALERNMRDIVAMEWALRVAPLTRNNTVGEMVTAVAAIAAMTSVIAKLITTGFHV
ncbi:uncharacterized protein LOC125826660 [Solanum verrucosum]|uniref:uncharacterized protein LOC125826660 n=1 Tax=Solanum verrucosum TaxID=315347 RepID=UPI0020D17CFC|nr:uncharacterized protein LOC125826660 [Solanum verrucosum]